MNGKPQRDAPSDDADGVRVVVGERKLLGHSSLIAVVFLTAVSLFFMLHRTDPEASTVVRGASERIVATDRGRVPERRAHVGREPRKGIGKGIGVRGNRLPRRIAVADGGVAREEAVDGDPPKQTGRDVSAGDYIAALRASGETAGLAAFPQPGTRPLRRGVIVPDDYDLPEGFARHYQTTDDGRQLSPVLVIAPGYEILDDSGAPIALTDSRIVPPEYAPLDLPLEMLEPPAVDGSREESR